MKPNEFSKRLGVPTSTLRYYDRQGITRSSREAGNNYRDFNALDALDFYNALMLRSFDMSLADIASSSFDLQDVDEFMSMHIPDLENQIRLEEMRLQRLREMKFYIEAMEDGVGKGVKLGIQDSYAIWTLNDDHALLPCELATIQKLAENFPYSYVALGIDAEELRTKDEYTVKAGLGILVGNAEKMGIERCANMAFFDASNTYGVFIESEDPLHLTRADLEPIYAKAKEDGVELQGSATGRIYLRYNKDGKKVYGFSMGISAI